MEDYIWFKLNLIEKNNSLTIFGNIVNLNKSIAIFQKYDIIICNIKKDKNKNNINRKIS